MCQLRYILTIGILGLSSCAVGTLPDYVAEDANPSVHINLKNCGNGVVDLGEECDCGPVAQKCREDSCCQTNCQFKLHAQCSSREPCCDENCKFKSKGSVCQIATHDCGISEYCSGDRGSCSATSYKRNGANCVGEFGRGICIAGLCKSFDQPCQDSWRTSSESEPMRDSSKCGSGYICVNQSCTAVREFVSTRNSCPKGNNGLECSGQGECTTNYHCHCFPGWRDSNCSVKDNSNGSKINEEKPGIVKGLGPEQRDSTSNTTALVMGLVSCVIIVSVIFVAMAVRYLPSRPPKDDSIVYPPPDQSEHADQNNHHHDRPILPSGEPQNHVS
ncbi:disintegrin and metalloproteinase domain-containing protein 11 [Folsomia candida]|uniref:Disintegrin and metalloproteinase domain-containing protein 33 n=1 Tax=Folsomia candida TaxID=158441 RepID=A0A226ENE9_FOLCA|nr:disintegrin and metalloproteinase domain-containing protein 11 [Folsomia candida]OXA58738.1 Disintegrin and metalloproteinase domain-containing protein 33 [Folsomia candida]